MERAILLKTCEKVKNLTGPGLFPAECIRIVIRRMMCIEFIATPGKV